MIWIALYLSVALIDWAHEAETCYVQKFRFLPWRNLLASLCWPVVSCYLVHHVIQKSKDFPSPIDD